MEFPAILAIAPVNCRSSPIPVTGIFSIDVGTGYEGKLRNTDVNTLCQVAKYIGSGKQQSGLLQ